MRKILIGLFFSVISLFAFEHLSPENFDEKLKGKNVIVDFYAAWCPPCKILDKNLKGFDKLKPFDITIYKIDIEAHKEFAMAQGVSALPTIIFYKNGKMVAKEVGIKDVPQLTNSSKKHFK